MTKCPMCNKYTLAFDDYFCRFRCQDPECRWMAPSSTEMALNLIYAQEQTVVLDSRKIDELGLYSVEYDSINDALIFDFSSGELSFDLPEPDGVMIWKVGRESERVNGFTIVGAKRLGIKDVNVDILARKASIENALKKRYAGFPKSGKTIGLLVERVTVSAIEGPQQLPEHNQAELSFVDAIKTGFSRFEEKILT